MNACNIAEYYADLKNRLPPPSDIQVKTSLDLPIFLNFIFHADLQHFTDLATFLNSGHFRRKVPNSLLYRLPLEAHIKWRHQRIHPMCLNDKLRSRQHQTEGHLRPERVMWPWHWHTKMQVYITKTLNHTPSKEDPSRQVTSFGLTNQIDISSISKNAKDIDTRTLTRVTVRPPDWSKKTSFRPQTCHPVT